MSQTLTKDTIAQSTKPMVIEAFATWCPHCTKMRPLFNELEKELTQYAFGEFDVDKSEDLKTQFNISSLPTFIFIKNKKEVGRVMGEMSKDDLKKNIEKCLK